MSDPWQNHALCAGITDFTERPAGEQRPICRQCPVRLDCLESGIAQMPTREAEVVGHGGFGAGEIVRLAKARRRAAREARRTAQTLQAAS